MPASASVWEVSLVASVIKSFIDSPTGQMKTTLHFPEKAKNAILKVGKAQGFDYVLDASQGQGVIFAGGKDLLQDVKSELGF